MIYILLFFFLTYLILTNPGICLSYALHGLTIWYQKMVPSLLPFMILSSMMISMNLSETCSMLIHPITNMVLRCRKNVSYAILIGFLCGFPMGAKVTVQLLKENKISLPEARYLLAFCNNLGPVYMLSFLIPVLNLSNKKLILFGMYGLPFLYGIILRYTYYRKSFDPNDMVCEHRKLHMCNKLLDSLDDSIQNSISAISMLCGYMILFNMLNILPYFIFHKKAGIWAPLLEITGGILLNDHMPALWILIILPFGGLSCIAQTNSIIKESPLSLKEYLIHKSILTAITTLYYMIVMKTNVSCF